MFLQLGVEHVPILNILFRHFRKLDHPSLLLFFGARSQVDLESRSRNVDFLACWWEEDEVPLFLFLGDWINGVTISELGH